MMPRRAPAALGAAAVAALPLLLVLLLLLLAAAALPRAAAWHQCSAQGVFGGLYGYQAVANLSDFRAGLIADIWPFATHPAKELSGWQRYDAFMPFLSCPPSMPLRRVGSAADGGKIICDVGRLAPPCVVYSLGSQGDYSFEREMLALTQCEVHTFDCERHATRVAHAGALLSVVWHCGGDEMLVCGP